MKAPKKSKKLLMYTLSNTLVIADALIEENERLGGGVHQNMTTCHGLHMAEQVLKEAGCKKKWRYWGW